MSKQYKAKSGELQYKPSMASLSRIVKGDNSKGFCLACGKFAQGFEPDACKCECPSCKKPKVYGAEELLMMGLCY